MLSIDLPCQNRRMNPFFYSTILLLFYLFPVSATAQIINQKNSDTVDLILGFELCKTPKGIRQFSTCSDGFEQYFGIQNFFLKWNENKGQSFFINDYYTFLSYTGKVYDSSFEKADEIENSVQLDQIVAFNGGRSFKHKVNRDVRRVRKIGMRGNYFDGKFYYALFRVKLVRKFIGKEVIVIPELNGTSKAHLTTTVTIDLYHIEKIIEIEPIKKRTMKRSCIRFPKLLGNNKM